MACRCWKKAFRFEGRAKRHRISILRKHDSRKNPRTLVVYYCAQGRCWHVGHSQILAEALGGRDATV